MMGVVVPETCCAYKKYNKIINGIYLFFILQLSLAVLSTSSCNDYRELFADGQ